MDTTNKQKRFSKALEAFLNDTEKRIYLATAHYGKFINTVNRAIPDKIYFPLELQKVLNKKEEFKTINNDIFELEEFISNESKS